MLYDIGTLGHRVPMASKNALQCPHCVKHPKGRKRAEIARICSALPCNVSRAVAQCRRTYSCNKSGEAYLPDLVLHLTVRRWLNLSLIARISVCLAWFGFLLGFALQIATRGVFGGLRWSFAWFVYRGYGFAIELFEAALGIGETVLGYDAVEYGEHLGFLELDRIVWCFVTDPLIRVGCVLHEYIVAERELLFVFEQSRFDLYASNRERCHDRFCKVLRWLSL